MNESSLYSGFTRSEAIQLVGGEGDPQSLCDDEWIVFDNAVLCFTELGDPPADSHFEEAGSFFWVAKKPFHVQDDEHVTFIPSEVHGGQSDGRPIYLFVHHGDGKQFMYLGELSPSYMQRMGSSENFGEARFSLQPALPSGIWEQFGFEYPQDVDDLTLDNQLARLAKDTTLDDRFDILKTLVEYWHGEIRPEDGFRDEELCDISMPESLRRWYSFAGRRKEIMSGQNSLLEPSLLTTEDDLLVFYGENQWCYEWATSLDGEDPQVVARYREPDPWLPQNLRVSEHLILVCLFEGTMCQAKYGASSAWLEETKVDWLRQQIPAVPLPPWTWCEETRFFAGNGKFMFTMSNGDYDEVSGYSVWIGAKTEKPLEAVKQIVDDTWDYVSL